MPGNAFPGIAMRNDAKDGAAQGGTAKRGGGAFLDIIPTLGLLSISLAVLDESTSSEEEVQ